MCIGLPMQIIESGFGYARCTGLGIERDVDTLLIGEQPPGTWVLVFMNSAREVITEDEANKIGNAVTAIDQIMAAEGTVSENATGDIDALFADLIGREPEKPASLIDLEQRKAAANNNN